MVNPAGTLQIAYRTGLLQGTRRWDRVYFLDGVVLDDAACNIPARLYDDESTLYTPCREAKVLAAERTRTMVGTALPRRELPGLATVPPSTEANGPCRYRRASIKGTVLTRA